MNQKKKAKLVTRHFFLFSLKSFNSVRGKEPFNEVGHQGKTQPMSDQFWVHSHVIALSLIQHFTELDGDVIDDERLMYEMHPFLQHTLAGNDVVRIAGHVEHPDIRIRSLQAFS